MAQPAKPANDSEALRSSFRNFLRAAWIVLPVVGLIIAIYMVSGGGDPRRELKTVPATLEDYSRFIAPYIGPMAARPDNLAVDLFLKYFDDSSRSFFDGHYEELARQRFQFEDEKFKALDKSSKRSEAMLNLAARAPLSGFGGIKTSRNVSPSQVEVVVDTRNNTPVTITLHKDGSLYYLEKLAGIQPALEKELASQDKPAK